MKLVRWVSGRLGWLLREAESPWESRDGLRVWRLRRIPLEEPLSRSSQGACPGWEDGAAPHQLSTSTTGIRRQGWTYGEFECFLKLSQFSSQNICLSQFFFWMNVAGLSEAAFFSRLRFLGWSGERIQLGPSASLVDNMPVELLAIVR